MDRRQVLRHFGAGATVAWAAPRIVSVTYEAVVPSINCPLTLTYTSGGTAPHRFVLIERHGEFDCGPRAELNIELQFVGTLVATNGSVLRVPEGQPGWNDPVSVQAKCSTGSTGPRCPVRIFQSFEGLFQAG